MSSSRYSKSIVAAPSFSIFLFWFFFFLTAWPLSIDAFTSFVTVQSLRTSRHMLGESFLFRQESEAETNNLRMPYSDRSVTDGEQLPLTAEAVRQRWGLQSINYYSKVMREERRRNLGQISDQALDSEEYHQEFALLAKKHYFALRKAKDGQPKHAELIYQKIIHDLLSENEEEDCDHAKLAVTTLLLALHVQRSGGDPKKTRSVFLRFFRLVNQRSDPCACSAKVLIAFALFEMKQGNSLKSLEIVLKAIKLDPAVRPVLHWKQFRDSMQRRRELQLRSREQRRGLQQRLDGLEQQP